MNHEDITVTVKSTVPDEQTQFLSASLLNAKSIWQDLSRQVRNIGIVHGRSRSIVRGTELHCSSGRRHSTTKNQDGLLESRRQVDGSRRHYKRSGCDQLKDVVRNRH